LNLRSPPKASKIMSCGFFPPASATTDPSLSGDLVGDWLPESVTNPSLRGDKEVRGDSPEATAEAGVEGFIARERSRVGASYTIAVACLLLLQDSSQEKGRRLWCYVRLAVDC
jgi:hypothetical protein